MCFANVDLLTRTAQYVDRFQGRRRDWRRTADGRQGAEARQRGDLKVMKQGSVIVDVAVDQGAASRRRNDDARPTTYVVDGIIHSPLQCGGVPRTSTLALTTRLPYARLHDWAGGSVKKDELAAGSTCGRNCLPGVAGIHLQCGREHVL